MWYGWKDADTLLFQAILFQMNFLTSELLVSDIEYLENITLSLLIIHAFYRFSLIFFEAKRLENLLEAS